MEIRKSQDRYSFIILFFFLSLTGRVHDRGRNARGASGTVERSILGRGGAQRSTVHGGERAVSKGGTEGFRGALQGERQRCTVRERDAGHTDSQSRSASQDPPGRHVRRLRKCASSRRNRFPSSPTLTRLTRFFFSPLPLFPLFEESGKIWTKPVRRQRTVIIIIIIFLLPFVGERRYTVGRAKEKLAAKTNHQDGLRSQLLDHVQQRRWFLL